MCTVSNNRAADGGGLFVTGGGGVVRIDTSIFSGNIVTGSGGGVDIATCDWFLVTGSTFSGNSAARGGGLVLGNAQNTSTIEEITVADNKASQSGGGIYVDDAYQTPTIQNSTITGNTADTSADGAGKGGGIYVSLGTINLSSTIVAQNADGSLAAPDVYGPVSLSYSLIGDNTGSGLTEAPVGSPDNSGNLIGGPVHGVIDAKLGPLADNGGLEATETCALLAGSPAIDAGSNPANFLWDQRGDNYPRVAGSQADMGAYESGDTYLYLDMGGLSPSYGSAAGGTTVTIFGRGFTGATAVDFGATPATSFTVVSNGEILATSPAGTGIVDVTVTTPVGTTLENSFDQFRYVSGPLVVTTLIDKLDTNYDPNRLSLREALSLTNGNPGGVNTITFAPSLSGGTIDLSLGELAITDSVDIGNAGSNITIDAGGRLRIFDISDGDSSRASNVTIAGLTLTDGSADNGGAIYSAENLTLDSVTITESAASQDGGGLYALGAATSLRQCTISGNTAGKEGGGIYIDTVGGTCDYPELHAC